MSNEHGSQVKDQGRRQFCHNKHKKFPYRPKRDVSLISGYAWYGVIRILNSASGSNTYSLLVITDRVENTC
jgi:hypothetical protein